MTSHFGLGCYIALAASCGAGASIAPRGTRTAQARPRMLDYWLGRRHVVVSTRVPSSMQAAALRECEPSGENRPDLFAPIVTYVQSELAPSLGVDISGAALVNFNEDTPNAAWAAGAVAVESKSVQGMLLFRVRNGTVLYCIDVHESDQEIIITLDHVTTVVAYL